MPNPHQSNRAPLDAQILRSPSTLVLSAITNEDGSVGPRIDVSGFVVGSIAVVALELSSPAATNLMRTRACELDLTVDHTAHGTGPAGRAPVPPIRRRGERDSRVGASVVKSFAMQGGDMGPGGLAVFMLHIDRTDMTRTSLTPSSGEPLGRGPQTPSCNEVEPRESRAGIGANSMYETIAASLARGCLSVSHQT